LKSGLVCHTEPEHVRRAENGAERAEKIVSGTFEKREEREREVGERERSGERAIK
jgi:hypothetical protein